MANSIPRNDQVRGERNSTRLDQHDWMDKHANACEVGSANATRILQRSPPVVANDREIRDGPISDPLALSVETATHLSGLSRATLYRAIAGRQLVARKYGSRTVILREDLQRFLMELPRI
jgi:Helix-turn-helix domain